MGTILNCSGIGRPAGLWCIQCRFGGSWRSLCSKRIFSPYQPATSQVYSDMCKQNYWHNSEQLVLGRLGQGQRLGSSLSAGFWLHPSPQASPPTAPPFPCSPHFPSLGPNSFSYQKASVISFYAFFLKKPSPICCLTEVFLMAFIHFIGAPMACSPPAWGRISNIVVDLQRTGYRVLCGSQL